MSVTRRAGSRTTRPGRDDRGAVAVMVAAMATLLLLFAAISVDLGNAFARRTAVQSQADHSALAGGAELTGTVVAGGTPSSAVVDEVRDYLNLNYPQTDDDSCWRDSPVTCVSSADLTNGVLSDGEVEYTAEGMRVTAPAAFIDFGFAGAVVPGLDGTDVNAAATVNVFTGGKLVLPMYAFQGCDWGSQTIGSPPSGHLPPTVPATMQFPSDSNQTTMITDAR